MSNLKKQKEIQRNINLYLDQALHNEENASFMEELQNNPDYPHLINQERNFRDFIKNNVKRPGVSTDLIQTIMNRIKLD